MTTSPILSLSELADTGQAIPLGTLVYLRERTRARLYDYVLSKFLQQESRGLTQAHLARRIKRDPTVLNRWFASPSNWTIDAISDLLAGIAGEELEPHSVSLLNRPARNYQGPDWLTVYAGQNFTAVYHAGGDPHQSFWNTPTLNYAEIKNDR